MSIQDIRTPWETFASLSNIDVVLQSTDVGWKTNKMHLPVLRDQFLSLNWTSKKLQMPTHVEIIFTQKREGYPKYHIQVENFGSLPSLFPRGILCAKVQCSFIRNLELENFESASIEIKDVEEKVEFESLEYCFNTKHIEKLEVNVSWNFSFLQDKMAHHDKFLLSMSYNMQQLDGSVTISSSAGNKKIKISKWLLAVFCTKFNSQMSLTHNSAEEIILQLDESTQIGNESLHAFIQFLLSFSLVTPIERCSVALDLLKAGHYNMFPELIATMQTILLAQPCDWFDLRTSCAMYCYATKIGATRIPEDEKEVWNNLKWKALRNMKNASPGELVAWLGTEAGMQDTLASETFMTLLSTVRLNKLKI